MRLVSVMHCCMAWITEEINKKIEKYSVPCSVDGDFVFCYNQNGRQSLSQSRGYLYEKGSPWIMSFGECHEHLFMNGCDYRKAVEDHKGHPREFLVRQHLQEYQKRGITFVREGGDDYGVSSLARKLAPEYGIHYRTSLFAIHRRGRYGAIVGKGYDTLKEYADLVKQVKKLQGDFIKIMTTGIMDFQTDHTLTEETLPLMEVREMVHIAHEEGLAVMAHTNGAKGVLWAVEAGVDSVEHGNFQDKDSLEALAQSDTVWVPTCVTVKNLIGCGRFSDSVLESIYREFQKNLRYFYQKGGQAALGSDAGAYRVLHGQGLQDEYAAFQETLIPVLKEGSRELEEWLRQGENKIRKLF